MTQQLIAYRRVSTREQGNSGLSLEAQQESRKLSKTNLPLA
jgi:hypothetical protein